MISSQLFLPTPVSESCSLCCSFSWGFVNAWSTGLLLLTHQDVDISKEFGESLHFVSMVWSFFVVKMFPHRTTLLNGTLTWWQKWYSMCVMLATYQWDLNAYDCRGISSPLRRPACHCTEESMQILPFLQFKGCGYYWSYVFHGRVSMLLSAGKAGRVQGQVQSSVSQVQRQPTSRQDRVQSKSSPAQEHSVFPVLI